MVTFNNAAPVTSTRTTTARSARPSCSVSCRSTSRKRAITLSTASALAVFRPALRWRHRIVCHLRSELADGVGHRHLRHVHLRLGDRPRRSRRLDWRRHHQGHMPRRRHAFGNLNAAVPPTPPTPTPSPGQSAVFVFGPHHGRCGDRRLGRQRHQQSRRLPPGHRRSSTENLLHAASGPSLRLWTSTRTPSSLVPGRHRHGAQNVTGKRAFVTARIAGRRRPSGG